MTSVIISTVGPYHAFQTARAAAQAGFLKRLLIGINQKDEKGIPPGLIKRITIPAYIGYGLQQIPTPGGLYFSYLIRDNLFDLLASGHVEPATIFHGWNHQSLYSLRRAIKLGAKVIIERSNAHPEVQDAILREEFARYSIRYPASARWLISKHIQEYEEADVIIVCSEFVRRTMLAKGIPAEKLRLIPVGFDPARFKPGRKKDDVFRVIYVGLIGLRKGIQYLLEAFRSLNLPHAELLLVGGKTPESRLFLPQYEGVYKHIPFVPQEKLAELYQQASVFVLPSLEEGFGMVVAEAAASGIPVIITENVGAMIRDGQDGFVVPIRDSQTLATRLLQFYENDHLIHEMGQSAHEYIQQFTWEHYHQKLITCYQELT